MYKRQVLYAASDFVVMTMVVPLLVALDGIHHRAGDPFPGPVPMVTQAPLVTPRATSWEYE